jgi:NAD-dependent SIR2 family protein deacetylase
MKGSTRNPNPSSERVISMGSGLAAIPERLLLAHAHGEVLFIAGAGISRPSGLPDFRGLVINVYKRLDTPVYEVISKISPEACKRCYMNLSDLNEAQSAEVRQFINGEYDVVLGMLERRMDKPEMDKPKHILSKVRQAVVQELKEARAKPAPIHRALMGLADRGGTSTIITTNFDLLLEDAAKKLKPRIQSYNLDGIPRPTHRPDFAGILHIHGALDRDPDRISGQSHQAIA